MVNNTKVILSEIFEETEKRHHVVADKVDEFVKVKSINPTQRFGASDTRFNPDGPLGKLKISHAHLSQDISILYRIAGSPPTIYVLGLFSHKETGTSGTANVKKQKSTATTFRNEFPLDQYPDLKEEI